MKQLDEIKAIFTADRFATDQGMTIDEVSSERTVCSMIIRDGHKNGMGNVQGGVIFTLADFAFAVAANHEKIGTVTLDSTIHFLKTPKGERLVATATPRHEGRTILLYDIEVRDDSGRLIAQAAMTGYRG